MKRRPSGRASLCFVAALLAAGSATAQVPIPGLPKNAPKQAILPFMAIKVGTIHRVDAPPIEDGVILVQKGKIKTVGKASEVRVPNRAKVIEYPDGHAYPGFIDALSTAYSPRDALPSSSTDASSSISGVLDPHDSASSELAKHGVTTAYVSNRGNTTWRGTGAIVRPVEKGFLRFRPGPKTAVHLRMTTGTGSTHPLTRRKSLGGIGKAFEGLESYEKTRDKYAKKLEKYEKEFDEYIEYHAKKNGKEGAAKKSDKKKGDAKKKDEGKKAESGAKPSGERGSRRRPGRGPRGERPGGRPRPDAGKSPSKDEGKKGDDKKAAAKSSDKDKKDSKAPKRPSFPKKPRPDPVKDVLIDVRDGDRALRVEAHRDDEIRAALDLKKEHGIDTMILEGASAANLSAEDLANAGVSIVFTKLEEFGRSPYGEDAMRDLVQTVAKADVPFAIGSGQVRRARHLPLIAARATALGVDEKTALEAITLTPAQMLGIDDRVGSIREGKLADIVVTSGPLFASDSKIVEVIAGGKPLYSGKDQ